MGKGKMKEDKSGDCNRNTISSLSTGKTAEHDMSLHG